MGPKGPFSVQNVVTSPGEKSSIRVLPEQVAVQKPVNIHCTLKAVSSLISGSCSLHVYILTPQTYDSLCACGYQVFACTVGQKPSKAQFYVDDTVDVVALLEKLVSIA